MKVLFYNRDPNAWRGGDMVQMTNIMKALNGLGVETSQTHELNTPLYNFNLVNVFHINFPWVASMYDRLIREGFPYVITSIFFTSELGVSFQQMGHYVRHAKAVICQSETEKNRLVELVGADPNKAHVIPNGVDKTVFKRRKTKVKDRVVSIGRLTMSKGADLLVNACNDLELPLCYIESSGERGIEGLKEKLSEYYRDISPEQVAELLQTSRLFVCPSLYEVQSISVIEAAACGCPIVDTIHNMGSDFLPSSVVVDPTNSNELKTAIKKQWGAKRNTDRVFSWQDVARMYKKVYEI